MTTTIAVPGNVTNLLPQFIETSFLIVNWTGPSGENLSYTVYWTDGNSNNISTVNQQSMNITNLTPGVKYSITVWAVASDKQTKGANVTISVYTKPGSVMSPQMTVTTSSISLNWTSPPGQVFMYKVEWVNNGGSPLSTFTTNASVILQNLTSGTNYTITVTAFAGDNQTKGAPYRINQFTKPQKIKNIMAATRGTNYLNITWTLPGGRVDYYVVNISNTDVPYMVSHTTTGNTFNFTDLLPGRVFTVTITSVAEGFTDTSDQASFATYPTPTESIIISHQSTSSLQLQWKTPPMMNGAPNISYFITNQPAVEAGGKQTKYSAGNSTELTGLMPGTLYSFTITTVGPQNLNSTAVYNSSYTLPEQVSGLTAVGTTTTLSVKWKKANGTVLAYSVMLYKGTENINQTDLNNDTDPILFEGLIPGVLYYVVLITKSGPVVSSNASTFNATFPNPPGSIMVDFQNVSSINFTWSLPYNMDHHQYNFSVLTNNTAYLIENNWFLLGNLQSGSPYNISVVTVGVLDYVSTAVTTRNYTKPELVQPSVHSGGSNSSISVSWTKPHGNVEKYTLSLNSTLKNFSSNVLLNSTNTSYSFDNLSAGVLYSASLTTCSGPFCVSSEFVTNATYPNPPGLIEFLEKTISSIAFRWDAAPLMTNTTFHYILTITESLQAGNITVRQNNTRNNSFNFSSLLSGTSYNISVKTRGPMEFESVAVYTDRIYTRPLNVTNLMTAAGENFIIVTWTQPVDYKETYQYNLTRQNPDGNINYTVFNTTAQNITDLVPGSQYNISVTTETSDGTQAASKSLSVCTNASPVKSLNCSGPNSGNAELIFNWIKPEGGSSGFQFSLTNNSQAVPSNASCCHHNISNLLYNTEYNVNVKTLSCGNPSTPIIHSCTTGITSPSIPSNYQSLVHVVSVSYNTFTVSIDFQLLNDSHGPITHVGILVTRDGNGNGPVDKIYLEKTYKDWRSNSAPVYLATVQNYTSNSQARSTASLMNIQVGSGTTWNNYSNGALDPSGNYKFAIVIFTSLDTKMGLVNYSTSIFSITNYFNVVNLDPANNPIAIAIGATLGIFGILFIILIGFIIYRRRLSNKESSEIQIQSMRAKVSAAVRVEDFETYYRKQKADSSCGFAEEFEDLKPVGTAQAKLHAMSLDNKPKNRYNNVLPYDSSRVKLSIIHGNPNEDYINANYMPGYLSRKEFIAAQGPLPATVSNFWRMIWEKNVHTLVMLTRCNEQGRVKCEQYWGYGTNHYEDITVTITSEITLEDWTIRDFDIKNVRTTEVRAVRQFHFTAWPDHGVPETTELLISFRHLVREHMNQYQHTPTVVHCSAGVGRTGTFIAIDRLIYQIERENVVDVYGIVHDLRMHRPLMVQTEDQYVFLNQCALDIIRSRTGTNVDLIYQNAAAISIYENVDPKREYAKREYD